MKLLNFNRLFLIIFLFVAAFCTYLLYPYWKILLEYQSLAKSGVSYKLRGQEIETLETETLTLKPASTQFGLTILKLGINQKISANVDYYEPDKLKAALKGGLAHGLDSFFPGELGGVLLIGHPLDNLFDLEHFHPEFYLIKNLEIGDIVNVFYQNVNYPYRVEKKEIKPRTYLNFFDPGSERKLFLVAGDPPGTTFRFLVIEAKEIY